MPIENKKNYENEQIDTTKLDHWYGTHVVLGGVLRMVVITTIILGVIYAVVKLSEIV